MVSKLVADNGKKLIKKALVSDFKGGRTLGNLYTGKKLNSYTIGAGIVGGGLIAGGGVSGIFGAQNSEPNRTQDINNPMQWGSVMRREVAPVSEVVESPSMLADGTGRQGTKAPTLSASGDMVMGMHNLRHGKTK